MRAQLSPARSARRRGVALLAVLLGFALVAAACGDDDDTTAPDPDDTSDPVGDEDDPVDDHLVEDDPVEDDPVEYDPRLVTVPARPAADASTDRTTGPAPGSGPTGTGPGDNGDTSAPVPDDPVEDDPVEDDPVEDDPVEDDPVEDDPVEDDPVEDDPVEDDPVEDDPVEDDPVEDDPVEDDPVEDDPPLFHVAASAGQITVTGATEGTALELAGPGTTRTGTVDELGNLLFRDVEPGTGWRVFDRSTEPAAASEPLDVPTLDDHPDRSFYDSQEIGAGYGYIEMRDGTLLAAMVRLPGPIEDGPYPTVIEYSGYDPANPADPEPTIGIYGQLGYATVGVNMRGSGCSGGAFDYYEPLQTIDGYDMIEAIATQDWVYANHVGMVGISYSGISQLFVAQTQPPSLAAITPLSVIEDTYRSTLYPGGIYNDGFAKSWGDARQGANEAYGQGWVVERVESGDKICDANQLLRSQNADLAALALEAAYYDPALMDHLSPRTFVDRITVPTFLAGAWQDEQTGGRFPTMLDNFTGTDVFKVHLYNGAHADSLGPESLVRAVELLDVYVAERTPAIDPFIRFGAPILYQQAFGVVGLELPPDRFATLEEAIEGIGSEPPIRVLLEMGGNESALGGPLSRGEVLFDSWPAPEAVTRTWNLADDMGAQSTWEQFEVDVERSRELTKRAVDDDDGNEFDDLQWALPDEGKALVYESGPFTEDALLLGTGRVSLSVHTDQGDADLQVTISEVRPDGYEMFIQSGWLRASHRALDATETTDVLPWHTHTEADAAALPDDFTQVDVELFPAGHIFRAGSRLRLVVDSPGGNRNLWTFDVLPHDGTMIRVDPAASTLSLPFVAGVEVPEGLPDCENTRSQPCRLWVPYANDSAG